jgi:predicted enzyme related to lactoylglutathione lyase
MNRVVHFEIHADDLERAKKFYESLFGWKMESWPGVEDYYVVTTGPKEQPGIDGGMLKRKTDSPKPAQAVNAYVCTIDVDNLDEMGKKVMAAGGKLALEKIAIGDLGWVAYYIDTEGNIFGLYQDAKASK